MTTSLFTRALRLARMAVHIAQGLVTLAFVFPRASPARRQRLIRSWDGKVLKIFGMRTTVDTPPGFNFAAGLAGTPAYMAPERAAGSREQISEKSDVYLLGAILFRFVQPLRLL